MHRLFAFLVLSLASTTQAMAPPLSPEERAAQAALIVDGNVVDVVCMGVPERADDGALVTSLQASLQVLAIEKQPLQGQPWGDLGVGDVIELPFDTRDYGTGPRPGCAWVPSYRAGQSGRWWLTTRDGDTLTLVSWNSFEADEGNAPLDLPICDGTDAGPVPAGDGGSPAQDGGEVSVDGGFASAVDAGAEPGGDAGGASADTGSGEGDEAVGCSCSGLGLEVAIWPLVGLMALRRRRLQRS